jgi:hypothetical protein
MRKSDIAVHPNLQKSMDGALIDAAGAASVAVWQKITAPQYAGS